MTDASTPAMETPAEGAQTLLETLCRQPSVAVQGVGMAAMADLTESLLRGAGFATRRFEADGAPPAIYGEQRGSGPYTLLLYNHYDVHPAEPIDLWDSPPFTPTVRDGKLYARGVADNKGEFAARLAAIHALRAADGTLQLTIRWIVEGEEEIGSPHFAALTAPHAGLLRADGLLWEGAGFDQTGRPELCLGTKGLLYVQFGARGTPTDTHSSAAPILPSAAWRLVGALGTLRGPDGRVRIPGFYDAVRPPTPAERAALADQPNEDAELREAFGVKDFVDGLSGTALLERLSYSPTCNISGLVSGYTGEGVEALLPARATAKLDLRLVPDQDPRAIVAALRAHLAAEGYDDVRVTVLEEAAPVVTPLDDPFVGRIAAIAASYQGTKPTVTPIVGATLPLLGALRRHSGLSGLGAPGNPVYWANNAHAPNEHIRLSDLHEAVAFNMHLFRSLGAD